MPSPLTESLVIQWRPTVRYHQHRLDVLAELKSEGVSRQWRVTEDQVAVRTDTAELTMTETGVSVYPRGSLTSEDVLHPLRLAFAAVAPPAYGFRALFQFLLPILNLSYDAARQSALGRLPFGPLGASDFSVVLDGKRADTEWHSEFGIVSEEEVEPRMRRWVGQSSKLGANVPPFVPVPADLAAVSFFADLMWVVPEADVAPDIDDAIGCFSQKLNLLREAAADIISQIHASLCEGALQPVAEGSEP